MLGKDRGRTKRVPSDAVWQSRLVPLTGRVMEPGSRTVRREHVQVMGCRHIPRR